MTDPINIMQAASDEWCSDFDGFDSSRSHFVAIKKGLEKAGFAIVRATHPLPVPTSPADRGDRVMSDMADVKELRKDVKALRSQGHDSAANRVECIANRIEELEAQLKIHDEIIAEKLEQIYCQSTRIEELEAELLKERRENEAAGNRIRELRSALTDCLEYLEARQDVEDCPSGSGQMVPDETMRLAVFVGEMLNEKE